MLKFGSPGKKLKKTCLMVLYCIQHGAELYDNESMHLIITWSKVVLILHVWHDILASKSVNKNVNFRQNKNTNLKSDNIFPLLHVLHNYTEMIAWHISFTCRTISKKNVNFSQNENINLKSNNIFPSYTMYFIIVRNWFLVKIISPISLFFPLPLRLTAK